MTFEAPIWLALAPVIVLLSVGLFALGWRKRGHLLSQFAAARLLETLTEKASLKRRVLKSALIVAAVAALALALARPQYGIEWSERKAKGLDIVFALDSSKSMLATDLRPTRLERAKLAMLDLIDRLESDRIGLVAFAGQAFLQTPPTLDYGAFRESLKATDPSVLSRGGSDLGRAIEEAAQAFPAGDNVKVVVLLTDGEDLAGEAIEAARTAAAEGIQIFTIGIGTPEGEYLRISNAQGIQEFVRDADGQPVRSQLDEATLQQIAQITGGSYTRLGGGSLEALYTSVLATLPREERESELEEVPIERFQWLLAAALTLLVLEMMLRNRRPGATRASAMLCALFVTSPQPAEAAQADNEPKPYNQAYTALTEDNYAEANQLYTQAMQETEDRALQRDALYNMGHATYQLGRAAYEKGEAPAALEEIRAAEKLFESALEIDPDDSAIQQDLERTQAVREALEKLLEQEEQEKQQKEQQQEDQQDSPQSEETQAPEGESAENQDPQSPQQGDEQNQPQEGEQSGESGEQPQNQSGESEQSQEQSGEGQQGQTQEGESDAESPAAGDSQAEDSPQEQSAPPQPGAGEPEEGEAPQRPTAEDPAAEDATGESTQPVPEVAEPETGESAEATGSAAESGTQVPVEGMTLQQAQDLLESLRGKEQILPFTQPAPGRGRPLQDW